MQLQSSAEDSMQTHVQRLLEQRKRHAGDREKLRNLQAAVTGPKQSRRDQLISKRGHLIHKLKAKDSTGRWAYYFVYVPSFRERQFLKSLKSNKAIDLEDYGKIIGSCYGEEPSEFLKNELREKYRFEI